MLMIRNANSANKCINNRSGKKRNKIAVLLK